MRAIRNQDFSVEAVLSEVMDPRAGAIVVFIGTVRKEGKLKALDYDAYDEMVVEKLEKLRKEAKKTFSLTEAAAVHRKGRLAVGERVVIVACSAPHRREAFRACDWLISEIKKVVPIWKREI